MADILDVYLDEQFTGQLNRGINGEVSFEYADDQGMSLSVSMPRSVAYHPPQVVMPWLDNLLPDNDDVRARWAASFGMRGVAPYDLLRHIGADCAGAVQILPQGQIPDQAGRTEPVGDTQIAEHLRLLRQDSAAWDFPERGGRWSLGGQQGKFALAKDGSGWLVPSGRAASTHIFKVGVTGVPDSDVAEFVTMRVAAVLGLPVPPVEYRSFEGEMALVTTRFDRLTDDGHVRRLHQEDLCQALGLWRTMKYQSDGGPSESQIITVLNRVLDPRDRQCGVTDFIRAQVFHWITASTDAHAKNYALLHLGSRVVLAPFYDLISTAFLGSDQVIHYRGRLAMKFGGEYRLRKVDSGRYDHAAEDFGIDQGFLVDVAKQYCAQLPDAVRTVVNELPDTVEAATKDKLIEGMDSRLTWIVLP